MRTIWHAAAGLAAIPLATIADARKAASPDIEVVRKPMAHVSPVPWSKPARGIESSEAVVIELKARAKPLRLDEEKQLHALAVKAAVGDLTESERALLSEFDSRRIRTQKQQPVEVIEKRERLFRVMDNLLTELNALKR